MQNDHPETHQPPAAKQAWMLMMWQRPYSAEWLFKLQSVDTGQRQVFSDLDELVGYLRSQLAPATLAENSTQYYT